MIKSRWEFVRSLDIGLSATGAAFRLPSSAYEVEPARVRQDGFIHLDSNENAYGPSAKVASAVRSATMANRYPFLKYDDVTEQIATFQKVKPKQVLFGCGSTEIVRVAAYAFAGGARPLIPASPTFEAIADYARSVDAEVISVPLDRKFAHDLHAMLGRAGESTGLVYICNPSNPTASTTPREDLENLAANRYLRGTVRLDGPPETRGAVKGSSPVSGGDVRFQYPNLASKFFVDAMSMEKALGERESQPGLVFQAAAGFN